MLEDAVAKAEALDEQRRQEAETAKKRVTVGVAAARDRMTRLSVVGTGSAAPTTLRRHSPRGAAATARSKHDIISLHGDPRGRVAWQFASRGENLAA